MSQQGDITYLVKAGPDGFITAFAKEYGTCASSMAWRSAYATHAFKYVLLNEAKPYTGLEKYPDAPAI